MKMKKIVTLLILFFGYICFSAEKYVQVPITGGFGINLGSMFDSQMEVKLKATRAKYDDDTVGYKVVPPKPLNPFNSYTIFLTKTKKIYKIQAICIDLNPKNAFSHALYIFQQKYGNVTNPGTDLIYIDQKNPSRSIRISLGEAFAAIQYIDTSMNDKNDDI